MDAERIKKIANCSVCNKTYQNPKYLPCHHSYCEECVAKLQKESTMTCPECKETSVIPTAGVKDLPNNIFIKSLVDEVTLKCKIDGECVMHVLKKG